MPRWGEVMSLTRRKQNPTAPFDSADGVVKAPGELVIFTLVTIALLRTMTTSKGNN